MFGAKTPRSSALGLIVLWLLYEKPLHVYGMQKPSRPRARAAS